MGNGDSHVSWEKFVDDLYSFLNNDGIEKLKNTDLILSFKRGGMILGTILCCKLQDLAEEKKEISLRGIPKGVYNRRKKPFYLIDKITDEREYKDISHLIDDIDDLIEKNSSTKFYILLVDDNLTSGYRMNFFKNILKYFSEKGRWSPTEVEVETLCYCTCMIPERGTSSVYSEIDHVINNERYLQGPIEMPWHEYSLPFKKIKKNEYPNARKCEHRTLKLETSGSVSIGSMYRRLQEKGNEFFREYNLENYIENNNPFDLHGPFREIFGLTREGNKIKINRGSYRFVIEVNDSLTIKMMGTYSSNPRKCTPEDPIEEIEEKLRMCNWFDSDKFTQELCYDCLFWFSFKDLFKTIFNPIEIKRVEYYPNQKYDESLSKWVREYIGYIKGDQI